jgi:hypothetical protein
MLRIYAAAGWREGDTLGSVRAPLLSVSCFALALACESPPPRAAQEQPAAAAPSRSSSKPAADSACQAEPLHAELASFCELDIGVPPIELAKVPWTAEPYHPLATRVITLDNRGLTDPEGDGSSVSIQAWLADPPRRIPEPGEMVFAIAADVPATTVAELQRGLAAAGRKQIQVLAHINDLRPIPQPRDAKLLATMRDALPSNSNERVVFVAKAVQEYAQTCPPVAGVFPQLTQVSPGDRCAKLGELAANAIVECGCAKLDEIMTLLYALTIGFDVPVGRASAVAVVLDPDTKFAPAAGATWGELAATPKICLVKIWSYIRSHSLQRRSLAAAPTIPS